MKPERFIWTAITSCIILIIGGDTASAQLSADVGVSEFVASPVAAPFVKQQLRHSRVREARESTEMEIKRLFRQRGIKYPAAEVYLRVFKAERSLELWVRSPDKSEFELLKTYRICALAGAIGPKRREGDRQVPEGFYNVDLFNPASTYHLSMRIDYPNKRDVVANTKRLHLGGDIFIHGGCKSEGCLAITDEGINEVYWVGLLARARGQLSIPVHIFPARFGPSWDARGNRRLVHGDPSVKQFWKTLKPGYYYFERFKQIPPMTVDGRGQYRLTELLSAQR
jgi:murein L,D-transpeptidase YafK